MNVTDAINARRSIRKYKSGNKIAHEDIKRILDAAMKAPSACNTRPWEFIVLQSEDAKSRALRCHPRATHIKDASAAILVCARPDLQQGVASGFFPQDCAAAVQNILLEATQLGYGSCWCGIYPREDRMEDFQKEFELESTAFALVILGTADEAPQQRGFYDESRVRVL